MDNFATTDLLEVAVKQWSKGLSGIDDMVIEKAVDHCRANLVWPPSIAEFIEICDQHRGLPDIQELIQLAVRRDFRHPLVKDVFDAVGSFSFSNDIEKVLEKKVTQAYKKLVCKFRNERIENNLNLIEG